MLSDCGVTKATLATGLGRDSTLSPDGTQVATTVGTVASSTQRSISQVHVKALDGSSDKIITPDSESGSPTWAPAGRQLAYATPSVPGVATGHIYVNTPSGSAPHQLTNDSIGSDGAPAWSPDGRHIAFIRYDTNSYGLSMYSMDPTGANQKLLYSAPKGTGLESPTWTPDSNYIVFSSVGSSGSLSRVLGLVALSGGAVGQLPTVPGGASRPTISQDWSLSYIGFSGGPHVVVQPIVDSSNALVLKYEDGLDRPEFRPQGSVKAQPAGFPPAGVTPPQPQSGDVTPPTVAGVTPTPASSADPLLVRTFQITASDEPGGSGLDHFDYVWGQGAVASDNSMVRHVNAATTIPVSFADAGPDGQWNLFVRAVDKAGNAGSWFKYSTKTPSRPILVTLGDSVVSGHHLAGTDLRTVCDDPNYSYASDLALRLQQALPAQWRSPSGPFDGQGSAGYYNYAHSGFSTAQMLVGGKNYCKDSKPAAVAQAARVLGGHRGSWNRVIITAGIDDTNWGDAFSGPIVWSMLSKGFLGKLFFPAVCSQVIHSTWSGYQNNVDKSITADVHAIVDALRSTTTGDPLTKIDWTGYYDISGTGPLDADCHEGVVKALSQLTDVVRAGLPIDVTWIDAGTAMDRRGDFMQQFFNTVPRSELFLGWPHPLNPGGTSAISTLFRVDRG